MSHATNRRFALLSFLFQNPGCDVPFIARQLNYNMIAVHQDLRWLIKNKYIARFFFDGHILYCVPKHLPEVSSVEA